MSLKKPNIAVGDHVRILRDNPRDAMLKAGDVVKVIGMWGGTIEVADPRNAPIQLEIA